MSEVKITEVNIVLPTYGIGKPDRNPMFLEKRVYQASKGNVYPYPFIEKVEDKKFDKEYKAIIIENDYIELTLLPELGGRIQFGYDKIHDYDFFYRNKVIKPALVGLAGPWISGGVEFNWPQHHRPSTYSPCEYSIEDNEDGSKTVWMSEIEMMSRMVGKVGITVYPDKAYVEVKGSSYNYSNIPQNFLWWANIAVHVHDQYESFFPVDVKYVADHGKREVAAYPFADRVYYNVDYPSLDLDNRNITNYKNIPVPMSYMAMGSDYDFFGGYDYKAEKGTMYVSNHHTAPGKKQWTWGSGDFGIAWDRQLTDEDGPYIELMAGAYTDNQPDFTWINPFEKKEFNQYWYPFKNMGKPKNANLDAIINIEYQNGVVDFKIGTPGSLSHALYEVFYNGNVLKSESFSLSFESEIIEETISIDLPSIIGLGIRVFSSEKEEIISFEYKEISSEMKAKPAIKALAPKQIKTNDELYQIGIHLEQYRHATVYPDDYYLEALNRNPNDIRCNTAYGMLLLKRHQYEKSISFFEQAIDQTTKYNPNPKDCEPFYGKGLAHFLKKEYKKAYDAFYKSIWDYTYRSSGYFKLAQIDCIRKDYKKALIHIDLSLSTNSDNTKAHNLKTIVLRRLNQIEDLKDHITKTIKQNSSSYLTIYEQSFLDKTTNIEQIIGFNEKTYIELAIEYLEAGEYDRVASLLLILSMKTRVSPMVYYLIGYAYKLVNNFATAETYYRLGDRTDPEYCFPHRVEEKVILMDVIETINSGQAAYLLGNLLYDKLSFYDAIEYFEYAKNQGYSYSVLFRNLGVAYYNVRKDIDSAKKMYEKALEICDTDGRIVYELDQLYKIENRDFSFRLNFLNDRISLVYSRDDLYLEYVTLHNLLGKYEVARELLLNREFHPFEGGEGKVSDQYRFTMIQMGLKLYESGVYEDAISYFNQAKVYPLNLGEGKIYGTPEADINYMIGLTYKKMNQEDNAKKYFTLSANEEVVCSSNLSYKPEKLQMNYFQAKSLEELGEVETAEKILNDLVVYAGNKANIKAEIDYFAISVPEFLIFETDLDKVNKTHCYYLLGLGYFGLGEKAKAKANFEKSIQINGSNYESRAFYLNYLANTD